MAFESASRADLQNLRRMQLVTGRLQHSNSSLELERQLFQTEQLLRSNSSDSETEEVETGLFLCTDSSDLETQAFLEKPTRSKLHKFWCCWCARKTLAV